MDAGTITEIGWEIRSIFGFLVGSDFHPTPQVVENSLRFSQELSGDLSLSEIEEMYNGAMNEASASLEIYAQYSPNSRFGNDPLMGLANFFGGSPERNKSARESGWKALEMLIDARIAEGLFVQKASDFDSDPEGIERVYQELRDQANPEVSEIVRRGFQRWAGKIEKLTNSRPDLVHGDIERGDDVDRAFAYLMIGDYEAGVLKVPFKGQEANRGTSYSSRIALQGRFPLSSAIDIPLRFFDPTYVAKTNAEGETDLTRQA